MIEQNDIASIPRKTGLKPLLYSQNVNFGCDPEFFFAKEGKVIGSEKVLPAPTDKKSDKHTIWAGSGSVSQFIIDGVQAELNPTQSTCRAGLGNSIHLCFQDLYNKVLKDKKDISADFSQCVEVDQAEMDSLSDKAKVFGCAPSVNAYNTGENKTSVISVDPTKYRGRSAGGHIHLGITSHTFLQNPHNRELYGAAYEINRDPYNQYHKAIQFEKRIKSLVPVLDIVVGNTCVLIDRAESNKERRKVYGKAGEHRLKPYGIEYRTLSNFWLRSYQLMSFSMSLCRLAYHLVEQSTPDNDYVEALYDAVKREDIIKAINENDFDLAMKNFKAIEDILTTACAGNYGNYPFSTGHMNHFYYFVSMGVDHWFDKDVLSHWVHLPEGHGHGWENWLAIAVANEYQKLNIDLNDPKYKEVKPEKDIQDYVNGYGKMYKPLISPNDQSKSPVVVTTTAPAAVVAVPPLAVVDKVVKPINQAVEIKVNKFGRIKKLIRRKKVIS